MNEYYYHYLGTCPDGKLKQRAYYLIRQGLEEISPSFSVPRLENGELADIFNMVCLDHPEIFYAFSYSYHFYPQAESVEFIPSYLFKKKEIEEHRKALNARIRKLTLSAAEGDDLSKEQFVHDFICRNVRYDKLKKEYSHEIIGPLTQGVGVCEGIAKTVKILCNQLNIPCVIVLCGNNPVKGIKYRHAWNIVQLNKKHYHLDATFDNTLSSCGEIRYDYFNTDDSAIFRDHEPLLWPAPACNDRSEFWYIKKKLSFTKMEEVRNRTAQAVKKNRALTFHWRGGYLTREVLKEICAILEEEAEKKGKVPCMSLDWPQAVLHLTFDNKMSSGQAGTEICLEQSNEGEQTD